MYPDCIVYRKPHGILTGEINMNTKNNNDINFSALFDNIIRRFWLILLVAVLAAGGAYAYVTFFVQPLYSSTATLYIGNRSSDKMSYTDATLSETLAKDFEVIIKKRQVLEEVAKNLELNVSAKALSECITVNNISNTRILDITVSTPDPSLSKSIADTVCSVASEKIVSIVKVDYVSIVDTGSLSSTPSNISLTSSMILAGIAGALICTFCIMVRTLMDDKIKNPDDVEFYLGLSVLGTTPFSKELGSDRSKSGGFLSKRGKHKNDPYYGAPN